MKTVVFGKRIEKIYTIDNKTVTFTLRNGEIKTIYNDKPRMRCKEKLIEWVELLRYKGSPKYNSCGYRSFNISENEEVHTDEEIFRADLNESHLLTDKIVSETNNKEKVEQELAQHIRQFNKAMIESNDKMLSYCEIHKLSLEETDCVELFQLLYPGHSYQITDGKMLAICRNDVSKAKSSSVANYDDDDWEVPF